MSLKILKGNLQKQEIINLFLNGHGETCYTKEQVAKKVNISIYELDHILDAYYAELDKANVFSRAWTQVHPNSYTLPKKQSFIDFIVKKEHVKLQKSQLKERSCFDGGVSNAS